MPIKKVKGGYRWGTTGKVYKRKSDAVKQMKAIGYGLSKEQAEMIRDYELKK